MFSFLDRGATRFTKNSNEYVNIVNWIGKIPKKQKDITLVSTIYPTYT